MSFIAPVCCIYVNYSSRLSWLVVYLIFIICLDALATIILYALGVFVKSNAGLIFLLFFLFDLSVLALAFVITPFFDKARVSPLDPASGRTTLSC